MKTDIDNSKPILLVGDEGTMAQMLEKIPGVEFVSIVNSLRAIAAYGQGHFALVLVNAESCENHLLPICAALKKVRPDNAVYAYGPGYCEVFVQNALQQNLCDDFLPLPIPSKQLSVLLKPSSRPKNSDFSKISDSEIAENTITKIALPEIVHQLMIVAQAVPLGPKAIIQLAAKALTELFDIQEVTITDEETVLADYDFSTVIKGPCGFVDKLWVRGDISVEKADNLQLAGDFIANILYLARRDETLKYLSITDELTGAYNRRYLEYFINNLTLRADQNKNMSLLLFDLDGFKFFNDNFGHHAGDEILRRTTAMIRSCCRKHDIICRVGGDEFAVLFWDGPSREAFGRPKTAEPGNHSDIVMRLSRQFLEMMRTTNFDDLAEEQNPKLTVSGGLAHYPQDGRDLTSLLTRADQELLKAKKYGKNQIFPLIKSV